MSSIWLATLMGLAAAQAAEAPAPIAPAATTLAVGAPLTLSQARMVLAAASAEARRRGWIVAIAVVEPGGTLVAFERADGVQYASIDVAQAKARSAAMYRRPTLAFSQAMTAGRVQVATLPYVVAVEGGVPLVLNNRLVGAIGVSGVTSEQDGVIAATGAAAIR